MDYQEKFKFICITLFRLETKENKKSNQEIFLKLDTKTPYPVKFEKSRIPEMTELISRVSVSMKNLSLSSYSTSSIQIVNLNWPGSPLFEYIERDLEDGINK